MKEDNRMGANDEQVKVTLEFKLKQLAPNFPPVL